MNDEHTDTPLTDVLRRRIQEAGPLTIADYMALCLGHPVHGYYRTRDPFGGAGDFTTAPEISQMFGELLGIWCADVWMRLGRPDRLLLVELGPGRGTLMADALRAARTVPAFRAALEIHLIETSPLLRAAQEAAVGAAGPRWHNDMETVPNDAPIIILANEFLDALPVHQYERMPAGWCERLVTLDPQSKELVRSLSAPNPLLYAALPAALRDQPPGSVVEVSAAITAAVSAAADRIVQQAGAALFIDYGYEGPAIGETLQAVRRHRYADPLAAPGEADLTAHVDFDAVDRAARAKRASVFGPVPQGDFLRGLGIDQRAARLMAGATSEKSAEIAAATQRLTAPDAMGTLFKVLALAAGASLGPNAPPAAFPPQDSVPDTKDMSP